MSSLRTYSELLKLDSFQERFEYLNLAGSVGESTFGFERWINQEFYRSAEWKRVRSYVIVRDNGCDLGLDGMETNKRLYVHHMNPMTPEDIIHGRDSNLDPEYLISCTLDTHNAIHYGDFSLVAPAYVERTPGDHISWR